MSVSCFLCLLVCRSVRLLLPCIEREQGTIPRRPVTLEEITNILYAHPRQHLTLSISGLGASNAAILALTSGQPQHCSTKTTLYSYVEHQGLWGGAIAPKVALTLGRCTIPSGTSACKLILQTRGRNPAMKRQRRRFDQRGEDTMLACPCMCGDVALYGMRGGMLDITCDEAALAW